MAFGLAEANSDERPIGEFLVAADGHGAKTLRGLLVRLAAKIVAYICGQASTPDSVGRCVIWPPSWFEELLSKRLSGRPLRYLAPAWRAGVAGRKCSLPRAARGPGRHGRAATCPRGPRRRVAPGAAPPPARTRARGSTPLDSRSG